MMMMSDWILGNWHAIAGVAFATLVAFVVGLMVGKDGGCE
jgi:hypothetical protein